MAYFDQIAAAWEKATGSTGGPFKHRILNRVLLSRIPSIDGLSILDLGCGNAYFAGLLLRERREEIPRRLVLSDVSAEILKIARKVRPLRIAEYLHLDAAADFPMETATVDLVIATMAFNEMSAAKLNRALRECSRVIRPGGSMLATVLHPEFVQGLDRRGELRRTGSEMATMPGAGALRLPVYPRSRLEYERLLTRHGFVFQTEACRPDDRVLAEMPGLRKAGPVPVALVFDCRRLPV